MQKVRLTGFFLTEASVNISVCSGTSNITINMINQNYYTDRILYKNDICTGVILEISSTQIVWLDVNAPFISQSKFHNITEYTDFYSPYFPYFHTSNNALHLIFELCLFTYY